MGKTFYLGVRVEVASRFVTVDDLEEQYNKTHQSTKILDMYHDGKITVEKKDAMLIARGAKNEKKSGLINFSVMIKSKQKEEIKRIVQIVNVLGNDRIIRERVSLFIEGKSLLNAIPELAKLSEAFTEINVLIPGFVKAGWYYAPEAVFRQI